MQTSGDVVLITGASSGFGRLTAQLLACHNYRVFGTSRRARAGASAGIFEMLPLDVRSDESARACVEMVLERAGRIDVLINNAGHGLSGAAEEATIAEAQALFETNFFGTVRMVNAVLPHMRQQQRGRIINLSSVVGMVGIPFEGFYSASKHAVEGYSESLRYEVRPFNIHVSIIEPAGFETNFGSTLQKASAPIEAYAEVRERAVRVLEEDMLQGGADPIVIAAIVLRILQSAAPKLRYPAGNDAFVVAACKRLLPDVALEFMMRSLFKLDAHPLAAEGMSVFTRWVREM
jgi:NAD(P)-dependent dehydrogenase (short-subunit alcohol dehydrogenase family)